MNGAHSRCSLESPPVEKEGPVALKRMKSVTLVVEGVAPRDLVVSKRLSTLYTPLFWLGQSYKCQRVTA